MALLSDAADVLFCADPDGFIALRTELARKARTSGDREVASAIAALRKPTRAAWLVNLVVRGNRDAVDQLIGVHDALAAASAAVDIAGLRELTSTRTELAQELTDLAVAMASGRGYSVPDAVRDDIARTFQAAASDSAILASVLAGTLEKPLAYAGFGFPLTPYVPEHAGHRPALSIVPEPATTTPPPDNEATILSEDAARLAEIEAARQREIAGLRSQLAVAGAELADAERQVVDATLAADAAVAHAEELRARLASAEAAATTANEAMARAGDRLTSVRASHDDLANRLRKLEP